MPIKNESELAQIALPISFGFTLNGVDHTGHIGTLAVTVDGLTLLTLNSFPLSDLARKATLWSSTVDDDDHCTSFIYRDEQDRWLGAFRLEPRPHGWQLTSMFEDRRHSTLLELNDIRDAFAAFSHALDQG